MEFFHNSIISLLQFMQVQEIMVKNNRSKVVIVTFELSLKNFARNINAADL